MAKLHGLYRPRSLPEALALLAQDADAKPLSGGATLVAMMNARVLEPAALISLAGIDALRGVTENADGSLRIGAFTRHRDTASDARLRAELHVVRKAASQIANATVRNMGTIGGAIASADPGLDYPPALVAARATIEVESLQGRRRIAAEEFFLDWYTTALLPGELVTAVTLPAPAGGHGRYHKLARVAGDYAIASVALTRSKAGAVRVAIGGCGPAPVHADAVDALLSGDSTPAAVAEAGERLVALSDPVDDVRGSADYRRRLIPRLLHQAMAQ